jgi:RNA polymerase sigma factor (sigma-70 family)
MSDAVHTIEEALERYERPLLSYAFSLTRDSDLARDVVQDTFIRMSREDAGALDGRLAGWLFTVCRNRAVDVCRKLHRMSPTDASDLDRHDSESPLPSDALEAKETSARLAKLIESLPANQREVLRLKFEAGLSYREISDATRLSVSNVGFLIHTGIKTLRRMWRQETVSNEL